MPSQKAAFSLALPVAARHALTPPPTHRPSRPSLASRPSLRPTTPRCALPDASPALSPLTLDMADDTRLAFVFSLDAATRLGDGINGLVGEFKAIKAAAADGRRHIGQSLDYVHENDGMRVAVECNPNLAPDAFQSKVYVVVDDGKVKVSGQAMLTRIIDNVKAYKAAMGA